MNHTSNTAAAALSARTLPSQPTQQVEHAVHVRRVPIRHAVEQPHDALRGQRRGIELKGLRVFEAVRSDVTRATAGAAASA